MGVGKERYCDANGVFVLNESGDGDGNEYDDVIGSVGKLKMMSISTLP